MTKDKVVMLAKSFENLMQDAMDLREYQFQCEEEFWNKLFELERDEVCFQARHWYQHVI